ncbi:mannose-6-phosphate receptor binding domain-containing protein [Ephemerocybe angulata]|uniref:Autophagy-related protein 27 n=1 Tax=Ephemerocybe angulata TaxID=980116 RepID=A0A8H6M506_9AGAR|nr:mannose-6-phosphate receptor binding domain-containing protein [Tulosesus angulatus]
MSSSARKILVLSIYGLCALFGHAAAQEKACTVHHEGKFFDLTALKSSKDYHLTGTDDEIFPINVCQGVKTETFGVHDSTIADDQVAAFVRRGHGDFVIGKVNTTLSVYNKRPRMVLSGGSKCKSAGGGDLDIRASTVIDFVCDAGVFGPGQPRLVAALPPGNDEIACGYYIEWRTHYACPISEGGFIWNLFVFISVTVLTLLTAYTVLGTLYNRYVLQLRGIDQIPQFSIESMRYHSSEAIDWLKDIAAGLDIPGSNRSGSGAYGRAPSSNARAAPNPYSHQTQTGGIPVHDDEEASMGFARPQAGRKPETNPVSHQSQVIAETQAAQQQQQQQQQQRTGESLSFGASSTSSSSAPLPPPPQLMTRPVPTKLEVREATPAEREFMLGEDEEDEEDEDEEEEEEEDSEEDTPREESPSLGPNAKPSPPSKP